MKKGKQGNIAMHLSIMFGSIVLILVATFVYYMFIKPQKLEINAVNYTRIKSSDYNVNEDELNHGLFLTTNFNVNDDKVQMHKDLKDLYSGRDNIFDKFEDDREDFGTIDELNSEANNGNHSNIYMEEVIY